VDGIRNELHATREPGAVCDEVPIFVTAVRPAVVQHNIVVPDVPETEVEKLLRCFKQQLLRDVAAQRVPVVLSNS
jgi:hypothetical protein